MFRPKSIGSLLASTIVLVSIAGCDFLAQESVHVTIETDRTAYPAAPTEAIMLTVTNLDKDPIFFVCEGWVDLEETGAGRVVASWRIAGGKQCGVVTLEEGEHAERVYRFDDNGNLQGVSDAAYHPDVRYRIRFRLYKDRGREDPIDREDQYSNEFSMVRVGAYWR